MHCSEFLDRYSEYDDSLLSRSELDRFRAHLGECTSCARYDRVLRKGRMLARQVPEPEPQPEFVPRLQRRIQSWGRDREPARVLEPAPTTLLAAATVLVLTAAVFSMLGRGPSAAMVAGSPGTAAERTADGPAMAGSAGVPDVVPVALEDRAVVFASHRRPAPRSWAAQRVDPRWASSYSPLVTGPPRYRAPRSLPAGSEGSLQSD